MEKYWRGIINKREKEGEYKYSCSIYTHSTIEKKGGYICTVFSNVEIDCIHEGDKVVSLLNLANEVIVSAENYNKLKID